MVKVKVVGIGLNDIFVLIHHRNPSTPSGQNLWDTVGGSPKTRFLTVNHELFGP